MNYCQGIHTVEQKNVNKGNKDAHKAISSKKYDEIENETSKTQQWWWRRKERQSCEIFPVLITWTILNVIFQDSCK